MVRNPRFASAPSGTSAAELTLSASRSKMFFCRSRNGPQRGFAARKNAANGFASASSGDMPAHEALALRDGRARLVVEQNQHRALGAEVLAQARLELLEPRGQIPARA